VVEIVPFDRSHVPLFTRWFSALPNNDVWTEEWVHSRSTGDESYDPTLMIAAVENDEPLGFLLGSVAHETGWIKAFLVRPDRQRQGIGTVLFDAIERAFAERAIQAITVGWAPPRYLLPGIDISYTPAIIFLDRHGYETSRETRVNMEVRLTGQDFGTADQESRLRDAGITVRRALAQDRLGLTRLCQAYDHPMWAIETGMALQRAPITMFVAEREGEICAFAAHTVCGPTHFGPMLTAPDLRGLGIGTVLLKRCLLDWQKQGYARCEIVWTGPLSFYARAVGATMGRAFWVWHKSLATNQD
jgi:mycothiol synthase